MNPHSESPTKQEQPPATPGVEANAGAEQPAAPKKALIKLQEVDLRSSEDIIKTYKLKHGDYRVLIRILEANDLLPQYAYLLSLIFNPW